MCVVKPENLLCWQLLVAQPTVVFFVLRPAVTGTRDTCLRRGKRSFPTRNYRLYCHFLFVVTQKMPPQVDRVRGVIYIVLELGETDLDRFLQQHRANVGPPR